jgi:hypothetical protein
MMFNPGDLDAPRAVRAQSPGLYSVLPVRRLNVDPQVFTAMSETTSPVLPE